MNNAVTCHSLESFKTHGISQINQFTSFWPSESKLLVLVDDIEFPEKYYKEYNWDKERIILNRFSNKELERFKRKYTKKKYNGHKFFQSIRTLNPIKFLYRLRFFSYSFLFDVCKFSHKVFAMYEGAQFFKKGLLYWLDGDLITHTRVDDRFFNNFTNDNKISYFLDRTSPSYTETGFIVFNLDHEFTETFFATWLRYYTKGLFRGLDDGWTDCHTYDASRKEIGYTFFHNLSEIDCHHPLINCFLGDYFDHLKGTRKEDGKSNRKGDRLIDNDHPYWK